MNLSSSRKPHTQSPVTVHFFKEKTQSLTMNLSISGFVTLRFMFISGGTFQQLWQFDTRFLHLQYVPISIEKF